MSRSCVIGIVGSVNSIQQCSILFSFFNLHNVGKLGESRPLRILLFTLKIYEKFELVASVPKLTVTVPIVYSEDGNHPRTFCTLKIYCCCHLFSTWKIHGDCLSK
jgi:hypothetical protein